jgi:hypothetical protein
MMIGLLMVSAMMIRLAMRGLQFGDYQHKSRSTEFFLTACCIVTPMMIMLTCIESQVATSAFIDLPDVQSQIVTPMLSFVFSSIIIVSFALSLTGLLGIIQKNKQVIRNYATLHLVLVIVCYIASIVFIYRWAEFAGASWFGFTSFYEKEWPNLMRYVHFSEFQQEGMTKCPGGKYF